MTNEFILNTAFRQSAVDMGCRPEDLVAGRDVIVVSRADSGAKKYLKLPFLFSALSYGNGVVISASPSLLREAEELLRRFPGYHIFEPPAIDEINRRLAAYGKKIKYTSEYFLPDLNILRPLDCGYMIKILHPADFTELYTPQWSNALCKNRKELDVLGAGAYDGGRLIGLAGCSADCGGMWQIGIDVLPEYRSRGIGSALTSRLTCEIIKRGKVPFYCASWSNLKSVKNALKCGFRPAWIEMSAGTPEQL